MTIHIENLKFQCIIGILDFERKATQDVIVNAVISYKYKKKFINYADIVQIIKTLMIEEKFLLLEDAIEQISLHLLKNYKQIKKIELKITKPSILSDCQVSISNSYMSNS
ncbi:MAG: 7,8-dihydroneopterin aldolase/epimerase/oxygenase [Campylobacterota bacterium]|nr:7,8-dihydroneopterin aldolase/epimerase/oxygenase [Campylobacterota bacterium]